MAKRKKQQRPMIPVRTLHQVVNLLNRMAREFDNREVPFRERATECRDYADELAKYVDKGMAYGLGAPGPEED